MNQRIMDDGPALAAIADVITHRQQDGSLVDTLAVITQIVRNTGRDCDQ